MNKIFDKEELKPHRKDCGYYSIKNVSQIEAIYVISVFLWILLIFLLELMEPDIIICLFLIIPVIVYGINMVHVKDFPCNLEEQMFKGNFLSFGFLITIILLNWNSPIESQDKSKFFQLLVVAFILLMISLIDVWVDEERFAMVKHIKTSLNTAAVVLLALALYLYYDYYQRQMTY